MTWYPAHETHWYEEAAALDADADWQPRDPVDPWEADTLERRGFDDDQRS